MKKPKVAAPSVGGLLALPPVLARDIVASAVPEYSLERLSSESEVLHESFRGFAAVSKAWDTLARDSASELALAKFVVKLADRGRKALLEVRRQLTLRRAYLKTVEFTLVEANPTINLWESVFHQVPRLETLNLQKLADAPHQWLGRIIHAASLQCTHLQALVVHAAFRHSGEVLYPTEEVRRQVRDAVYVAMERAWKNSNGVGLRRLTVTMRFDLQGLKPTRAYLDKVLEWCPNLEVFDGYKAASMRLDEAACYEQWTMDIELWERFCATLTKLTEFDWICVPFATQLFEIFGRHEKPQLRKLFFTVAMNWRWDLHLRDLDAETKKLFEEKGYGATAKNVHEALRACPNLQVLEIEWYNPVQADIAPFLMNSRLRFPCTRLMDPEQFGDAFWEAAAQHCPQLSTISFASACPKLVSNEPIVSFTDKSLCAIASMPWLTELDLETVNVSGDGLFALAVHHEAASRAPRHYNISMSTRAEDCIDTSFYDAAVGFLEALVRSNEKLPGLTKPVLLVLTNWRRTPVDRDWSEKYLERVRPLLVTAHEKYPGIEIELTAHDCDGLTFTHITRFVFQTDAALEDYWKGNRGILVGVGIRDEGTYVPDSDDLDGYDFEGSGDEREVLFNDSIFSDGDDEDDSNVEFDY